MRLKENDLARDAVEKYLHIAFQKVLVKSLEIMRLEFCG